ncbi:Atp8b2 protein [Pontoporia blainvillei]|uniref:Atp8b2 protein n=1 Tax=Pontoporia blainvillei TaxID=48723 RepID=A0ABX0S7D1_PONBL|nr:Atp8b2 protein [Pontoporia blainvillei]
MILDHNDAGFEEKEKQLIDITGKNQDECVIALHDCNGDVNRAINVLLKGNPGMHSWDMVGKKKGVSGQKDDGQMESNEEGKENRDRDRDYSRRRGGPPRWGREHLPVENVTITAGQRIDLAALLGKTLPSMVNDSSNLDPSQSPSLLQPLVFSNLKQSAISQPASGNMFSHHSMVSMLGKEVGDVSEAKGGSTTGSQFLEQFKTAQALAQLAAQHSQSGTTTTSSWNMGSTTQSLSLMQYDLKSPNDSMVHSPFTKCQPFTLSSTVMEVFLQEKPPTVATSTAARPPPPQPVFFSAKQIYLDSSNVSWVFRQPILQSSASSAKTETAEEKSLHDF